MPKSMSYLPGSLIYFRGDEDERVFILQQGQVSVKTPELKTGVELSSSVKLGEFIGLNSALGHFPRGETVTAVTAVKCIVMTVSELEALFARNKPLVMKMLRVFSNQLREIHKEIENVLNKGGKIDQENGMFAVANAFYNDEKWRSCMDVLNIFLKKYPNSRDRMEALRNLKYAQAVYAKEKKSSEEVDFATDEFAFNLPAFERFAKIYEDGQVIISEFQNGDSFYLIQKGLVQLTKCANNTNKNLDILKPGEIFGEMAILDNSPRSATCVAKGKVQCLEFNKDNFETLVTGNPQIALTLLKLFCRRVHDQRRRFRILTLPDSYSKIADVFCMFDEMNPVTEKNDSLRRFHLSVSDIAHWAGLPSDSVSEEIGRFISAGKIKIVDDVVTVNNIVDMRRTVELRAGLKK